MPIILWVPTVDQGKLDKLKVLLDRLSRESCLTSFVDLFDKWQEMLAEEAEDVVTIAKNIHLICDRPDRLPVLSDLPRPQPGDTQAQELLDSSAIVSD